MATALGGAPCRRVALGEQLISRVLGHLTLAAAAPMSRTAPATTPACQRCHLGPLETRRSASSSSQWKSRQSKDRFARQAKVQGLKSRAAWKLIEVRLAARALSSPGSQATASLHSCAYGRVSERVTDPPADE